MQTLNNIVIAAAGQGTRLGQNIPKCLVDLNGITILERLYAILSPFNIPMRLVIGFKQDLVRELCRSKNMQFTFIENLDYASTNSAYSFNKGAREFPGKTLFLDGDLILDPDSISQFITKAQNEPILVGVTKAKSKDAVFVNTNESTQQILSFSRTTSASLEWANVVAGSNQLLQNADRYVFEELAKQLPLPYYQLDLCEVDTPEDFEDAVKFVQRKDKLILIK